MKEPMNNIWRGGAQHTTSESLEVVKASITALLPGTITNVEGLPMLVFADVPYYIVQEQLYGSVDEPTDGHARLLIPKSGTLFAVRCEAGQTITRDVPLKMGTTPGYVTVAASSGSPASVTLFAEYALDGVTTAGQLIPVRVK